jgi:hypothetical protein
MVLAQRARSLLLPQRGEPRPFGLSLIMKATPGIGDALRPLGVERCFQLWEHVPEELIGASARGRRRELRRLTNHLESVA